MSTLPYAPLTTGALMDRRDQVLIECGRIVGSAFRVDGELQPDDLIRLRALTEQADAYLAAAVARINQECAS